MKVFVYETTERDMLLQLVQHFDGLEMSPPLLDALLDALLEQTTEQVFREAKAVVSSNGNTAQVTDHSNYYVSFDDAATNDVCLSVTDVETPALFRLHVDYGENGDALNQMITLVAGILFHSDPSDSVELGWETREDPRIETTAVDAMGILISLRASIKDD